MPLLTHHNLRHYVKFIGSSYVAYVFWKLGALKGDAFFSVGGRKAARSNSPGPHYGVLYC